MNAPKLLKNTLLAAVATGMMVPATAGPLDAYRWKSRLILASFPPGDNGKEAIVKTTRALDRHSGEMDGRDLQVIDISSEPAGIPRALRLDPAQTKALGKSLGLDATGGKTVFILIGKDGGEKSRQLETLDLGKWFALIDGMPMRRAEMQDRE